MIIHILKITMWKVLHLIIYLFALANGIKHCLQFWKVNHINVGNWIKRKTIIQVVAEVSFHTNKLNLGNKLGNLTLFKSILQIFGMIF